MFLPTSFVKLTYLLLVTSVHNNPQWWQSLVQEPWPVKAECIIKVRRLQVTANSRPS